MVQLHAGKKGLHVSRREVLRGRLTLEAGAYNFQILPQAKIYFLTLFADIYHVCSAPYKDEGVVYPGGPMSRATQDAGGLVSSSGSQISFSGRDSVSA